MRNAFDRVAVNASVLSHTACMGNPVSVVEGDCDGESDSDCDWDGDTELVVDCEDDCDPDDDGDNDWDDVKTLFETDGLEDRACVLDADCEMLAACDGVRVGVGLLVAVSVGDKENVGVRDCEGDGSSDILCV